MLCKSPTHTCLKNLLLSARLLGTGTKNPPFISTWFCLQDLYLEGHLSRVVDASSACDSVSWPGISWVVLQLNVIILGLQSSRPSTGLGHPRWLNHLTGSPCRTGWGWAASGRGPWDWEGSRGSRPRNQALGWDRRETKLEAGSRVLGGRDV